MLSKGQKINERYEIIKSIGEGGMANVYLANDTILDRKVAIKVLRGDLENNDKFIRRFQREAKSVSDLSHPNIVEIYDVGEEDGQHYIVMEYIDGRTLKQLINKRGGLTVAEVIDIMTQLTDGLSAAHDAYIIHRDIKPQNIMILDDGLIKITDFGIAMTLNATQLTQTNSVMGSVHYLPPEQAAGQTATTKSDIYSAGILMYELLMGSVPFKGENAVEIALKQMKERIPSIRKQNPLIPQSVENIVLKATAKNPKNRYDNIKEMHDDLVHALDEDRQNETRYSYPYPESEIDESKEIPIKEPDNIKTPKSTSIEKPKEDVEEDPVEVEKDNKKRNIIILIALIAFLILVGFIFYFNYKNSTSVIIVPDVSNMKTEKAEKKLKAKGFKYTVESKESDDVNEGYVIKTTPKAGSSKKKGSVITIIESSGPTSIVLADYTDENANEVKEKLKKLGLDVKIEKKTVDNPSDYVGKENKIIDQDPKYNKDKEKKLKKDDEITLYIPDIYAEYPKMKEEGWTLAKAESFAKSYGLNLVVKDSNGKTISDYSQYLSKTIINQDRTGQISSGVAFTVTIDADTATYSLTINYYEEGTTKSIENSTKETHKNGESGNATCPGIKGYIKKTESVSYTINNQNTTVNCYYKKEEPNNNTNTTTNNNE
ncbi:MAG: Stk1 family PASTA domain-containing Ser/Thr kinase [Bacilli bacterium]|nr:Stk1 family PASTA domain-containing Ser/Thr kinase [Bacilli bacterium]